MATTTTKPVPTLAVKFPAMLTPNGDGSYTLKPGRPVKASPYTVFEAARLLGCSHQHVRNLIEEGKIAALELGVKGRSYLRIEPEELERFKASIRV